MATRSIDVRLTILPETPGIEHLQIHGTKLPTHLQAGNSLLHGIFRKAEARR